MQKKYLCFAHMDSGKAHIHSFEHIRHRGRIVGMRNQIQLPYIVFVRKEKENAEKEQERKIVCASLSVCVWVCVCIRLRGNFSF